MPSPFPGLDPYVENSRWWNVFHTAFIVEVMEQLNRDLPDQYLASSEQRLYIEEHRQSIRPDVSVIAVSRVEQNLGGVSLAAETGTETDAEEVWHFDLTPLEVIERFIEITVAGDESQVIAVIELLSPTNKALGSSGREAYLAKQDDVLQSDAHLVEIDLLRGGYPTVAVSPGELLSHGYCDSVVCLTPGRSFRGKQTVWPIRLRKKLPAIRIPLGPQEPPVTLDLQAVFNQVYDKAAFGKRIDYRQPPAISYSQADTEWIDGILKSKGIGPK
ncbi:MAG: hypothetical protein JWM11_3578 [Planctomycetaceae bacterium]|nr:hypothetical protein [Planctomycetaceae bacterium]